MKRIGSIVIALLFILTAVYTLPSTYAADNRLRGDADRNGEVTLPDSTLIQYVLSEIEDYDLDGAPHYRDNTSASVAIAQVQDGTWKTVWPFDYTDNKIQYPVTLE